MHNYKKVQLSELISQEVQPEKITNMAGLFQECNSIKELYINKFNTENVLNISHIF